MLIYFAARRGYTAAVEALLEHGALLQPPSRADNALIWAAAQPEACTLILQASRRLSREERRRLYSAPVPPGMPLPEAVTQPPGKPTWQAVQDACGDRKVRQGLSLHSAWHEMLGRFGEGAGMLQLLSDCRQPHQTPRHAQCVKLLRQCLNEVGLEAEVTLPPRAPKQQPSVQQQFPSLARMAESAAPEAAAGSGSAGAAGGNRHSSSHAAALTTTSTGSRGEISHTITADLSDLLAVGGRRWGAGCLAAGRGVPGETPKARCVAAPAAAAVVLFVYPAAKRARNRPHNCLSVCRFRARWTHSLSGGTARSHIWCMGLFSTAIGARCRRPSFRWGAAVAMLHLNDSTAQHGTAASCGA